MIKIILLIYLSSTAFACPDEKYCLSCNFGTKFCKKCDSTILLEGRCQAPKNSVSKCNSYAQKSADTSVCTQCELGYYLKNPFECAPCEVSGCALCSPLMPSVCVGCFDGKEIQLNFLTTVCVNKPNPLPNCDVSFINIGVQVCAQCYNGYALQISASGLTCSKTSYGCHALSPEDGLCDLCRSGYYIGKYRKCIPDNFFLRLEFLIFAAAAIIVILILCFCLSKKGYCRRRSTPTSTYTKI